MNDQARYNEYNDPEFTFRRSIMKANSDLGIMIVDENNINKMEEE